MQDVRPTIAVVRILTKFVDDVGEAQYGFKLMKATGYSSAKVYQILSRLTAAGWIDRIEKHDVESGGPRRVIYRMRPDAVPVARRMVQQARDEVAPPRRKRARGALRAIGVLA